MTKDARDLRVCNGCNLSWDVAVDNCPECGSPGLAVIESSIPGIIAKHCIITLVCRDNRGDEGAFDEAVARLRARYLESLKKAGKFAPRYHVVLTVERTLTPPAAGE